MSPGIVKNFHFSMLSRTVLGPTQPPIQWVSGVKRLELEADHSPPTSAAVKEMCIYTPLPIRLHGVVLRELSTRKTSKKNRRTHFLGHASLAVRANSSILTHLRRLSRLSYFCFFRLFRNPVMSLDDATRTDNSLWYCLHSNTRTTRKAKDVMINTLLIHRIRLPSCPSVEQYHRQQMNFTSAENCLYT
jgi:hypothetical protein